MTIKAIDTIYKGYKFRSRLEARWAVFFDAVKVKWDYEVEGFDCDGVWYLPDFILYDVYVRRSLVPKLYVEVKGVLTEKDIEKIRLFSGFDKLDLGPLCENPTLIVGNIPYMTDSCHIESTDEEEILSFSFIDGDWGYAVYFEMWNHKFGLVGYDAQNRFDEYEGNIYTDWEDYKQHQLCIAKALDKARQARFEHGSKGE